MNKDEALKIAVEYINNNCHEKDTNDIVKRLTKALEQPAQEPDRTGMVYYKNNACKAKDAKSPDCICWTPEQPAQEPVAWRIKYAEDKDWLLSREPLTAISNWKIEPLYTHPHQDGTSPSAARDKEFVTLTEDEIAFVVNDTESLFHLEDFARAIEAKLKEKNHGI